MIIATYIALALLALLTVFQLALIFGAPYGKFAWGGQHEVLPTKLRIGSVVSICIYAVFALFLLSKSGLWVVVTHQPTLQIGVWVMTIYSALGVVMNAISRSKPEMMLMTPVAVVLSICFLFVAL